MRRNFFRRSKFTVLGKGRGKSKLNAILIFSALVLLVIFIALLINSDFLKIKSVAAVLDKAPCTDSDQLKTAAGILGQNILFLDESKIQEQFKRKFICIGGVEISRRFPDEVSLVVSGRVAAAMITPQVLEEASKSASLEEVATPSAKASSEYLLVDNEGIIFSQGVEQNDLPTVFVNDLHLSLGKILDKKTVDGLRLLRKVKSFGIDAKIVSISENEMIIFASPRVIFRLDDKLDIQFASLQLILEKAKIDDVRLEFIDLRFDKPAVKIAPKAK